MGAARPSAGVAALNGSFVEFDGSGALGQLLSCEFMQHLTASGCERPVAYPVTEDCFYGKPSLNRVVRLASES